MLHTAVRARVAALFSLLGLVLTVVAAVPGHAADKRTFIRPTYTGTLELDYPDGRRADLYIPPRLPAHPQIWVVLHGANQDIKEIEKYGFKSIADQRGILVVYPKGWKNVWAAGTCCFDDEPNWPNEVHFLNGVVSDVRHRFPQAATKLRAVGFSNGGMMAYTWACQQRNVVGVAAVAGAWTSTSGCNRPELRVHSIHSVPDAIVPYYGGPSPYTRTQFEAETKLRWHFPAGSYVTQHKLMEGGHSWPDWAASEIWQALR